MDFFVRKDLKLTVMPPIGKFVCQVGHRIAIVVIGQMMIRASGVHIHMDDRSDFTIRMSDEPASAVIRFNATPSIEDAFFEFLVQ